MTIPRKLTIGDLTDEQLRRLWGDCHRPVSEWEDDDLSALASEDPDPPDESHKSILRQLAAEILRLRFMQSEKELPPMPTEMALPKDDPIMVAWGTYKDSPEYANSLKWAAHEEHREGSLWAAFITGWQAADKNAIQEQQRDE